MNKITTISLTMYKNSKRVKNYLFRRFKRNFFKQLASYNFGNRASYDRIELMVRYGRGKDAYGRMTDMHNSMSCYTQEDIAWGVQAFIREYL